MMRCMTQRQTQIMNERRFENETYHTPESCKSKVRPGVPLFSEPDHLALSFDTESTRKGPANVHGERLSHEAPKYDIISDID